MIRAYYANYNEGNQARELVPAMREEIDSVRQKVHTNPALALGAAMAKYHFFWFKHGTSSAELDFDSIEDAGQLLYYSIQFAGCNNPGLPMQAFHEKVCGARWLHAIMIYAGLGR